MHLEACTCFFFLFLVFFSFSKCGVMAVSVTLCVCCGFEQAAGGMDGCCGQAFATMQVGKHVGQVGLWAGGYVSL